MLDDTSTNPPKLKVGELTRKQLLTKEEKNVSKEEDKIETCEIDDSEQKIKQKIYLDNLAPSPNTTRAIINTTIINNTSLETNDPYNLHELKELVKNAAGPYYANYVSHFNSDLLRRGGPEIRQQAVKELIEFMKVLLINLKKEV